MHFDMEKISRLVLILFFSLPLFLNAQQDSCNCLSLSPFPDNGAANNVYAPTSKIGEKKLFTGVCHNYYMKIANVLPNYNRTYSYGIYEKGELQFYIQFNETGDTIVYFHRSSQNRKAAETKRYNYQTGKLEARELCLLVNKKKIMAAYCYDENGNIKTVSNYFYPKNGDSLNYSGNFSNYKKDAVLSSDGFYTIPVQYGPYLEYAGEKGSVKTINGQYTNNYKTGKWTTWYASGKIKSEGAYSPLYNWENGEWKEWYENGQLKSDIDYCNSNPCGKFRMWYENGNPKTIGEYVNSKRSGDFLYYYENGNISRKESYTEGKLVSFQEWYQSGQASLSRQYSFYGQLEGKQILWFENGKIKSEEEFKNGIPIIPLKEYNQNGTLIHIREGGINSIGDGKEKWYYDDGQIKSEETYLKGKKNGECTYYFSSGNKSRVENYFQGQKEGNSSIYSSNKKLVSDLNYKNNQLNGFCKWYYPNGEKWREFNYQNGVRDGICKEWNDKKELIYEQTYISGKPQRTKIVSIPFDERRKDSITTASKKDVEIVSAYVINNPTSNYFNSIFASETTKAQINNDFISILYFLNTTCDSAKFVHFDSSIVTHIYLDYPQTKTRGTDWPENLDKLISEMHFKPVEGELYGDDNGGIRRGLYTDLFFNPIAFNLELKKINSRYGCEYFGPFNSMSNESSENYNSNNTAISIKESEYFTDYNYVYYPYKNTNRANEYLNWKFRVYIDGSVDLLESGRGEFEFFIPE